MLRPAMSFSIQSIVVGTLLVMVCGCAEQAGRDAASGKQRQFITVGTAPDGGAFAPVGNAIASVVGQAQGDLNWVVKPEGTKGTQENIRKLDAGEIQFAMSNAGIAFFAINGEGGWDKKYDLKSVATLAPNVGIFVTTKSTGIQTVADLKGKRVVLGPAGAGFDYFLKPLLKAHGLTYEDLTVLSGNYLTAADMIADGKADAAFMGGAIPIPAVVQLCSTQDVVFLKLDADAPTKLAEFPFYFSVPVTADKYEDLQEDLVGLNVGSMQLITHGSVDEEVVYRFTKLLFENREAVSKKHPAGKALNPNNVIKDTGVPFHAGAIRFYKEAGVWPDQS